MTELRRIWTGALPSWPDADLERIRAAAGPLCETYACFWLFRLLHRYEDATATLAGDYCFGRFSHHLAAVDSVALTDAFADYLRRDTLEPAGLDEYLSFVRDSSRLV